jgi:uncharacterized protein (TIGR03083 family)
MSDRLEPVEPECRNDTEREYSIRLELFAQAASGFVDTVSRLRDGDWTRPALGEWDVRGLVGHTSRALSTVDSYLAMGSGAPQLDDPVEYFLAVLPDPADPQARARQNAAIAERGRQAGVDLGDDPAAALDQLAERVTALVRSATARAPVATPAGTMTLSSYLPTRTFELTVHTLDLARAIQLPAPAVLSHAVAASCELAGRLASRRANAADVLLGILGRDIPQQRLNVL